MGGRFRVRIGEQMRFNRLMFVLGIMPLCGCTLISRSVYNINYDKEMRADLEEKCAEHRKLAQQAWFEYWAASKEAVPDAGLADGFIDGFADFLDAGGIAETPAVPPNQFRFGAGTTPSGRMAATRYSEGFVTGAQIARASGLRESSLVPVFLPVAPLNPSTSDVPPVVPPRVEPLPTPRPVEPKPRVDPVGRRRLDQAEPNFPGYLPSAGP